jgi:hypothetical protein
MVRSTRATRLNGDALPIRSREALTVVDNPGNGHNGNGIRHASAILRPRWPIIVLLKNIGLENRSIIGDKMRARCQLLKFEIGNELSDRMISKLPHGHIR